MSSFDEYDPIEPFSMDEFIVHNNAELQALDAGKDCDAYSRKPHTDSRIETKNDHNEEDDLYEKVEESTDIIQSWVDTPSTNDTDSEMEPMPSFQRVPDTSVVVDASTALPLFIAVKKGKLDVVRILLRKHPQWITARDQEGKTLLHHTGKGYSYVENRYCKFVGGDIGIEWDKAGDKFLVDVTKIVQYLIMYGADINAKDNNGNSPLHWAIKNRQYQIAENLIELEADVNAKNNDGQTPLNIAGDRSYITEMLIEYGAEATMPPVSTPSAPASTPSSGFDRAAFEQLLRNPMVKQMEALAPYTKATPENQAILEEMFRIYEQKYEELDYATRNEMRLPLNW
jgi:hypothetical protein